MGIQSDPKMGIYWQWYFDFTDTDILILLKDNFFCLNITETDITNLDYGMHTLLPNMYVAYV